MKKVAMGLTGIVLSFVASGCAYTYKANQEVNQIMAHRKAVNNIFSTNSEDVNQMMIHYNAIKKIVGAGPEDYIYLSEPVKKGEPLIINVLGKNYTKIIKYVDKNMDGKYEEKSSSSVEIPDKLDIKVLPPAKPREQEKKENLQKKIDKSKLFVYNL